MVNQAEDLIRETFQKLGDTLGIHIDIPDEVIANLAATLQADIDRLEAVDTERFSFLNELGVAFRRGEKNARPSQLPVLEGIRAVLAHLTTAGRLIPAGGMALTAEQVEDVRKVLGKATTEYGAMELTAAWTRLRALFPATEPVEKRRFKADEETRKALGFHYPFEGAWSKPDPAEPAEKVKPVKFRKMTAKYATANFGFPDVTDPFTRWAYKDSDGDKWAWNGDQWELHIVPPAPAEPAEEETKAEELRKFRKKPVEVEAMQYDGKDWRSIAQWMAAHGAPIGRTASGLLRIHTLEGEMTAGSGDWIIRGVQGEFYPCKPDIFAQTCDPTSSPVVPAPTETGPWQTWQEVPEGVKYSPKARPPAGSPLRLLAQPLWVNRGGTRYQARSGTVSKIGDVEMFHYAPFVAAEEG